MLERAHGARINIDVGIEFLESIPSDAAAMPLPSEDTTPPVTKTYFVGSRSGISAPAFFGPGKL
jgi:hypothetical protein